MTAPSKEKETLKQSVGFSAIGSIGTQAISLLGFIVLARLLSPHEFGLMALVAIFTSFASIFIEMGMGAALIHNQEATEGHYSTAFWFNVCLALLCYAFLYLGSPWIALYFQQPDLQIIIIVVGVLLPLNALAIAPMAIFQKHQNFKRVAMIELLSLFCGVLMAVVMAYQGFGVWALVMNLIVSASVKVCLLFYFLDWYPRWQFSKIKLRELWSYSGYLMGTGIANYFITNVDSALVGKLLGSAVLGTYKYAYQLANLPGMLVSQVFSRVFFASYATYKNDKLKIRIIHFKAVRMIAFFTFPLLLTLSATSDSFVVIVLGEKWLPMADILAFMCFIFLLDSIGGMNNPLFLSQNKTKALFWLTVVLRSNLIIAMIVGIQFGLSGLLWGLLLAKVVNFLPVYVIVGRTIGFSVYDFLLNIMPPFFCAFIMLGVIKVVQYTNVIDFSEMITLVLLILIAGISYALPSWFFQKETVLDIYKVLFRRVSV